MTSVTFIATSSLGHFAAVTCFILTSAEPESTETPFNEDSGFYTSDQALDSKISQQRGDVPTTSRERRSSPGTHNLSPTPAPDEQVLMERILGNYHKYSRPVINASLSVVVKFGLTLVQISDMDEVNQVLTINVWLEQEWVDERLTWDPKDYNNLHILRIPCEKLWLPDIVLYNSADDYTTGYMNSKAMVRSDGNVFWPPPAKFRSSCKIDITYFPFDDQTCELKFGSWTYDGFQVDITNRSSTVDLNNYVFSGEWELMNVTIRRTEMTYACCIEPYPDVRFTIVIRRKTLYYLFNIIFPCLWLTILSLLGFWLPPDSGEKITLGITVLLAFSVFMLLIAESMPATSEFVPLIGIYLTVTMGMTSLSIILTVFVLQLHHVGPHKRRVPRWLRSLVFNILARIVCMYHQTQPVLGLDLQSNPGKNMQSICELSSVTSDRADVCGEEGSSSTNAAGGRQELALSTSGLRKIGRNCNGDVLLQRSSCNSERVAPTSNELSPASIGFPEWQCRDCRFMQNARYEMPTSFPSNMRNNLRPGARRDHRLRNSFRERYHVSSDFASEKGRPMLQSDYEFNKYQALVEEWQFVAHVTDRILFWLFLFVAVVSSLAILVFKPLFKPAVL